MPGVAETDGSEDVNDFLKRIKELGDQRDREDEERTRKLEEEIIQGRRERQARRAERARSLSPTKDVSTTSSEPALLLSHDNGMMLEHISKTPSLLPPPKTQTSYMDDALQKPSPMRHEFETQESPLPSQEHPQTSVEPRSVARTLPSVAMAPSRLDPLSWQQRPSSRGSTIGAVRSRPSSILTSENTASEPQWLASGGASSKVDDGVSKSQIAQTLGAKDPTFFKQTQDRGLGSAAYRRNQVEDSSVPASMGRSMRLPGMSKDSTPEPESSMSSTSQSNLIDTMSRESSGVGSTDTSNHGQGSVSMSSAGGPRSPLPASNIQRFEPPPSETTSSPGHSDASSTGRAMAMSPSQGRISPERRERPTSPTKGLGGFVQSAMMKRSDSVNKRWSAQAGPGLSRGNSVSNARGGPDGGRVPIAGVTPFTNSRNSTSRETTPSVNSRPTSSHSNMTVTQPSVDHRDSGADVSLSKEVTPPSGSTSGPVYIPEKTSKTLSQPSNPTKDELMMSPPSSPSKRWSPTKSSWLENAISKPESPKILPPAASQQPAWMANLHRNKQQRGSVDLDNGPAFKEVAVGGLVRSPPPGIGSKPPTLGRLPRGFTSGVIEKQRIDSSDNERQSESREPISQTDKLSGSSTAPNLSKWSEKAPTSPPTGPKALQTDSSAMNGKIKPETPPKKDFRTTLKTRPTSGEIKGKDEPEFKNVFGKLKKTQTQNYVAPDELKENIVRGKTGLAKTGGPQKSVIRDEFKESILKKKEGMVAPTASTRISSASSKIPDTVTPEAIAKRQGLGRSESTMNNSSTQERKPAPKPEALTKLQSFQTRSESAAPEKSEDASAAIKRASETTKPGLGGGFASSLAGILQKGPSPIGTAANPPITSRDDNAPTNITSAQASSGSEPQSGPELSHATKGRARGPKRKPPSALNRENAASATTARTELQPARNLTENKLSMPNPSSQLELSHNTSGSQPLSIISNNNNNIRKSSQPSPPRKPSTSVEKTLSSRPSPLTAQASIGGTSQKASPMIAQSPMNSQTISKVRKSAVSPPQKSLDQHEDLKPPNGIAQQADDGPLVSVGEDQEPQQTLPSNKSFAGIWGQVPKSSQPIQPKSPVKLPTRKDEEDALANAGLRPKEVVGLGIETPLQGTQVSQRNLISPSTVSPKSPPPLNRKPAISPVQNGDEVAIVDAALRSRGATGLGIDAPLQAAQVPQKGTASPSMRTPKSPPLPGREPVAMDSKIFTPSLPSPNPPKRATSPSKEPSDSTKLFTNIFDELPSSSIEVKIDSQAVVDARPSNDPGKIKTLRKQISELAGNGKSVPVPSNQEHILFEDSLYLCTHVFGTAAGARTTEVYLWCGDGVSSSTIEDAHLFAKKTAKDCSGKLMLLRQGKEPSNFFQALGGIVITRKGSSSRSDSAIYMLCGRQHLGQIAFDEVDFQPQNLCKGFPFIISARGGRLYLWKGSGARADELGCARLIGMDLGLTGEIEEIDEGNEPADFWSSFPTGTSKSAIIPPSAPYWHLKPSCERYATKLFEVDVEIPRPKSSSGFMSWGRRGSAPTSDSSSAMEVKIREVTPFSQADLVEDNIFVLDGFFEIFVILPLRTSLTPAPQHRSSKSLSLRAGLLFAQDYGILAASVEDRPFVPQSSVVVMSKHEGGPKGVSGEIPEGMRGCFRKWDSHGIKLGNVKVLQLAEALAADRS